MAANRRLRRALFMCGSALAVLALAGCKVAPQAIDSAEFAAKTQSSLDQQIARQEPIRGSIDLYEAIARALKYNLDNRVEEMQEAVKLRELNLASYQGLPNIVAGSGYTGRDRVSASRSRNILTPAGAGTFSYSTSSDLESTNADIALSWNVLDFGLSYVRAQQAGDQVLIQREMRRRALNRVVEDVRTAYWRAVAAEKLLSRLAQFEARSAKAIQDTRTLEADRQTSPVAALTYERELLEIKREAQKIEGELLVARSQLAALMNLPEGTRFKLSGAGHVDGSRYGTLPPARLVPIALINRPELAEIGYRQRINERDATAALIELLPGINAFLGANVDSNNYLYHSNWVSWGAKASWNLMKVFQYPERMRHGQDNEALLRTKAMAVAAAISTQVHVSHARYQHARKELVTATQLRDVHYRLLRNIESSALLDRVSGQVLLREQMNMVVSDVRYDLAVANVQNAYGNLFASLGLDAFGVDNLETVSVAQLSKALRGSWVGHSNMKQIAQAAQQRKLALAGNGAAGPEAAGNLLAAAAAEKASQPASIAAVPDQKDPTGVFALFSATASEGEAPAEAPPLNSFR